MNVSLTRELEQLVTDKVKSGMYQTSSEVIREGLRLLKERDRNLESLRAEIREGFEAVERGEYTDYTAENIHKLVAEVHADGRKRLAAGKRKTRVR